MNTILNFMKRNYKVILAVLAFSLLLWGFIPKEEGNNPEKDKLLLELLTFVIERGHYHPAAIDDAFSKQVYKEYIDDLDPSKRYFLQSDINEFAKYETLIDDQIKAKDLTFFELTYARLKQRIDETKPFYEEILENPIDYSIDENINTDYEKMPFVNSLAELKDRWRKQLKLTTLSSLIEKQKIEADKLKSDAKYKVKSYEELEKESRTNAKKSLSEFFGFVQDLNHDDWFAIYVNAIATRFDPHTAYFAPEEKERFDISMSGKLEGIGARLQKKNDYTEITELISGSPAWKSKELDPGDIILKVAQADKEPVDVVGMRLEDVVKKIKGPKGTEVRLTIKKTDGAIKVLKLIRDQIEIEETYLKSSLVEKNGNKYGIIYLPKFYIDFENTDNRDAAKDMAIEVDRLKKEGVKGIIVDVRDNGGGSLKTVVDIAGLFIEQGPIVQIKSAAGKKDVLSDQDSKVQWDGPLVIMTNEFSASASEILAAAIQDYKRGIILGSKQTYGKGTVQNVIDLNQFVRKSSLGDFGAMKTTTQKFYRINGGSTQMEGVVSDIIMPDRFAYVKAGERDEANAMPWDKIEPAEYKVWDKQSNFDLAIEKSKKRLEQNKQFQLIDENAKWINERSEINDYSLQLKKFKEEQDRIEKITEKYKAIKEYKNQLNFKSLSYEEQAAKNDKTLQEKRNRWHESLSKDAYVEEALHVLEDLNGGPKTNVVMKKR